MPTSPNYSIVTLNSDNNISKISEEYREDRIILFNEKEDKYILPAY